MTNTAILAASALLVFAYLVDAVGKRFRLPSVVLLILTGMALRQVMDGVELHLRWVEPMVPIIGTLGLILIVLEGALDLTVNRAQRRLIAVSSAAALAGFVAALAIFAAMFWVGLSLAHPRQATLTSARQRSVRTWANGVVALVFAMALSGGFVAGIRAGFAYNTFPLMNGHLVPPEIFAIEPWWHNFFWNMATVQFDHRALAWLLAVAVPLLWWKLRTTDGLPSRARSGGHLLAALVAMQIALGIATLLLGVPIALAAAHQAGAVLVFAAALNVAHALR